MPSVFNDSGCQCYTLNKVLEQAFRTAVKMATIEPTPIPPGKRRNAQRSTLLLSEYLALYYPRDPTWYELRLGPLQRMVAAQFLTPALERMLSRWNQYADAIVATPTELLVIEASMNAEPGKISQVLFYSELVGTTDQLKPYLNLAIVPVVLFATDVPAVRAFAAKHGVRYWYYPASWAADYLATKYYRVGQS